MRRDPSIHITFSQLSIILTQVVPRGTDTDEMAKSIMFRAKAFSLNSRTFTISNDKMEKNALKLVQASRLDTDLLAQCIYNSRKKLKHRGISIIKPGSRDWGLLKSMTAQALDFCNEFNLTKRYGFLKYIEVGLLKMKKFTLNKYLGMYEGICETYQALLEIENDDDRELTEQIYKLYYSYIIENTGINSELKEIPEKYVWFVRTREQAKKMNISIRIYMKAQFEAFDFTKGIPSPMQLTGPKATERIIIYCSNNGIKIKR